MEQILHKQKKILMLGGSYTQIPIIKYAKDAGYYVIVCDYLKDNPGQNYSNEFYNVSTTDKDAVLDVAKRLDIDGIVAYASDPAAPTAAYVSETLKLPGNNYKTIVAMSSKKEFRKLLKTNGFNCPDFVYGTTYEQIINKLRSINYPIIVKPDDSSGSKGVSKVEKTIEIKEAFLNAKHYSRNGYVIVEEFINKTGKLIGGDGFVINGKVVFTYLGDQLNDMNCNAFVPVGMMFPANLTKEARDTINVELQRLITITDFNTGAINLEIIFDENNKVYIIEVGPRNGGNYIPDITKHATGVDMIKLTAEFALGNEINIELKKGPEGFYAYYAIHSIKDFVFKGVELDEWFRKKFVIDLFLHKKNGEKVFKFNNSNTAIGILLLKFSSNDEMTDIIKNIDEFITLKSE